MAKGLLVGAQSHLLASQDFNTNVKLTIIQKDTWITAVTVYDHGTGTGSVPRGVTSGIVLVLNGAFETIGRVAVNDSGVGVLSFASPLYAKGGIVISGTATHYGSVDVYAVKPS
jgi:hypothetical protein